MNFSGLPGDIADIVGRGDGSIGTDSASTAWALFQDFIASVIPQGFNELTSSIDAWAGYQP